MSALAALGVVADGIGILSFVAGLFPPKEEGPKVGFNFFIGSDGARDPNDPHGNPLSNAGGNLPDIRLWEENGDFIEIQVNDHDKCKDGSVVCQTTIEDVEVQPAYTLFTANNDALCIAYATVSFPGETSNYAVTLGGFARLCSDRFEGRGGPWYWSDIWIQPEEGQSFLTECAWIDGDGDQPTTGISLHWPEFDGTKGIPEGDNLDYFCNNDPVMKFHTDKDPRSISRWTRKRNVFSAMPSVAEATTPADADIPARRQAANEAKAKRQSAAAAQSLVKSAHLGQTAKALCEAPTSAGPSFASQDDRQFCYMVTKTLYPFCADVESGVCFDDETDELRTLGGGDDNGAVVNLMAAETATEQNEPLDSVPTLNFTSVTHWG